MVLMGFVMVWGQRPANLVIFTGNHEGFTVIMNGFRVNDMPTSNLKVVGLRSSQYDVQVLFSNPTWPALRKPIYVEEDRELTLAVVRTPNGMMDLVFVNEFSLSMGGVPGGGQMVVPFNGIGNQVIVPPPVVNPPPVVILPPPVVEPVRPNPLPGYNGPIGCEYPMDANAFAAARESVASKTYASSRMTLAKQVTGSNCLLASQVKELMSLFSFESDKLTYAKFAYDYTYDIGNYYMVNDGFEFSSSIDELGKFLEGK